MAIKIKPEVIIEKITGYIQQLEELKKISYSEGNDQMYSIDAKIKSFLMVAFDNSKERNKDYQGIAIGFSGLSPEKEQEFYIADIKSRIRVLEAWKSEIELIIETDKDSSKIQSLAEQSEEKKLEIKKAPKKYIYGKIIFATGILSILLVGLGFILNKNYYYILSGSIIIIFDVLIILFKKDLGKIVWEILKLSFEQKIEKPKEYIHQEIHIHGTITDSEIANVKSKIKKN